jgi:hypothetical protein
MHGDAALFEALLAAADKASDPDEHYRYLYALGEFRDPALVERGLQLSLSQQLRSQDTALFLARFFDNPDARDRAMAFVEANWTALAPKVTISGGDTNLIRSMNNFCDARSRDRVSASSPRTRCGAARTFEQTLEVNNCIALRERDARSRGLAGLSVEKCDACGLSPYFSFALRFVLSERRIASNPRPPRRFFPDADADARPPDDPPTRMPRFDVEAIAEQIHPVFAEQSPSPS